jgi:hypothetical protein
MCRLILSAQVVVQDLHIDNDPLIANTDGDSSHVAVTTELLSLRGRMRFDTNSSCLDAVCRH